uniref:putative quinol monooxygenase n=1 Tax=Vibrio cholerae TaxID=666 RepID=UPI00050C7450
MSKVILKGFILVPEPDLELVKNELVNHKRLTLDEPGCITFSVIENPENPLRFDVYEEFVVRV